MDVMAKGVYKYIHSKSDPALSSRLLMLLLP